MALDGHVRRGHTITFALVIALSIVELGISGFLTGRYNSRGETSTSLQNDVRFLLFTSIWTIFFGLAYMVLFLHSASTGSAATSVGSHGVFLFITWIFWVAGAGAITDTLNGGNDCSNIDFELPYCNQLNAAMGFAWAIWVIITFLFVAVIYLGIRNTRNGDGLKGQLV